MSWVLIELDTTYGNEYKVSDKYNYHIDLNKAIYQYVWDNYDQDKVLRVEVYEIYIKAYSEEVEYFFYKKYIS
jgi:hypothetical protein